MNKSVKVFYSVFNLLLIYGISKKWHHQNNNFITELHFRIKVHRSFKNVQITNRSNLFNSMYICYSFKVIPFLHFLIWHIMTWIKHRR